MWVYKTRHDHMTSGIQGLFLRICLTKVVGGANEGNLSFMDEHSTIWDDTQATEFMITLGSAGNGEQLGGRVNQHDRLLKKESLMIVSPVIINAFAWING
jgi:hypothetical protein